MKIRNNISALVEINDLTNHSEVSQTLQAVYDLGVSDGAEKEQKKWKSKADQTSLFFSIFGFAAGFVVGLVTVFV